MGSISTITEAQFLYSHLHTYTHTHAHVCVDVVIRQMSERNKSERPELVFEKMDLLQMTYSDAAFDLVLDKGTCDALCTDASPETRERMKKMFAEVARLVCCSSCQVPSSVYVYFYVCMFVCANCMFETACSSAFEVHIPVKHEASV